MIYIRAVTFWICTFDEVLPLRLMRILNSEYYKYNSRSYKEPRMQYIYCSEVYGHGIQSFLLCALSIALSVAFVLIASYSMASSLHAVLPITLTIMHFDGTSLHPLHNICI